MNQMGRDLGHTYTHLLTERQNGKQWVAYADDIRNVDI